MRIPCVVVCCLWLFANDVFASDNITINGVVKDSATKTPLPFVTVRIVGTSKGAFTAKNGDFVLKVKRAVRAKAVAEADVGNIRLAFSMVGYSPDTISLSSADTTIEVFLAEKSLRSSEIMVSAEDPAYPIMRKVLARKKRQVDTLKQYTYSLYTKFVLITDTSTAGRSTGHQDTTIFSILESFSKGFFVSPDNYYNEIVQRRQSANIPAQANFLAIGTNLNLLDDFLTILSEKIETPFHPGAIDDYDFKLTSDEQDQIVSIKVSPRSADFRAFEGTVFIDQSKWMPIEVRLVPNKAVNMPFDAKLNIRQSFIETNGVIVPEALSIRSTMQADILFVFSPRLDIDLATMCYDYRFDEYIDPDVFQRRRVEAAESAEEFDSTYWNDNLKLPLRSEEEFAYKEIERFQEHPDSSQTSFFDTYVGPLTRGIARLNRRPFSSTDDIFRYNYVHGPYLGLGLRFRPDTSIEIEMGGGYGFADKEGYGWLKSTYFLDKVQQWSLDGSVFRVLARRDDPRIVQTPLITWTSLLFGSDYGDYYYSRGWEAGISHSWGQMRWQRADVFARPSSVRLFVRSDRQSSAVSQDVWSLFSGKGPRPNPPIFNGSMQLLGGELLLNYFPYRMNYTRIGLMARLEVSEPRLMPSDFAFTRTEMFGFVRFQTLPLWTMDLYASVGWTSGNVPPQKFFSLESAVTGIAIGNSFRVMDIKEFYGDRYATFTLSHNFGELVPGLLRIPNIASFGIEVITFGSVGWTTFADNTIQYTNTLLPHTDSTRERVYYELGLGLNRLLLFFRFDVNARFSQRDTPQFRLTLSSATF